MGIMSGLSGIAHTAFPSMYASSRSLHLGTGKSQAQVLLSSTRQFTSASETMKGEARLSLALIYPRAD